MSKNQIVTIFEKTKILYHDRLNIITKNYGHIMNSNFTKVTNQFLLFELSLKELSSCNSGDSGGSVSP